MEMTTPRATHAGDLTLEGLESLGPSVEVPKMPLSVSESHVLGRDLA